MKIADFVSVNDSIRTLYNVYRGNDLVDVFEKDYLSQNPENIPEANRRLSLLMDTNGYVTSVAPAYRESKSQLWIHVDVQIGTHDYPDRL